MSAPPSNTCLLQRTPRVYARVRGAEPGANVHVAATKDSDVIYDRVSRRARARNASNTRRLKTVNPARPNPVENIKKRTITFRSFLERNLCTADGRRKFEKRLLRRVIIRHISLYKHCNRSCSDRSCSDRSTCSQNYRIDLLIMLTKRTYYYSL